MEEERNENIFLLQRMRLVISDNCTLCHCNIKLLQYCLGYVLLVSLVRFCYAMKKQLRSVRYAKFEVCIGGRPPSASFHRAHRSHNGGDIVILRLAEIQIPNSVLCATTIFLYIFKMFLVSSP